MINPVEHEKSKNSNSDNFYMDSTFCEKNKNQKFSDTQVFLQRITKGVIRCVLFDAICYCFHTSHEGLSLYGFPSTASVCLTPVKKCEIYFQLFIAL